VAIRHTRQIDFCEQKSIYRNYVHTYVGKVRKQPRFTPNRKD